MSGGGLQRLVVAAAVVVGATAAGACGESNTGERTPSPPAAAKPESFPAAGGGTIDDLRAQTPQGPQLFPAVRVLRTGENRFAFMLSDQAGRQLTGADAAVYTSGPTGADVRGPFPARSESLAPERRFRSRNYSADRNAPHKVYIAGVPLRDGRQRVVVLARLDGRLVSSTSEVVNVGRPGPPEVGDAAPRVSTPTVRDRGTDPRKLDTRDPPGTMHEENLAEVVGRRPVVLVVASPKLCPIRTCAAMVDQAEQVKARLGDRAAFIHMETYAENRRSAGLRPEVRAWGLDDRPWVFAIDSGGRIVARLEGAASIREIEAAARKAIGP